MAADSYCPYCHSVKSILLGNVYCSLHGKPMGQLGNGTFSLRSKVLEETHDHISRLSIRCMLNGEQHYKVGGNDFLVKPNNYLIVNQGQHYKTSFRSAEEQEMILVAFRPGFAEGLYYSLSSPADTLLDEPFGTSNHAISFFEKTYETDPIISGIFGRLKKIMDSGDPGVKDMDMEGIYTRLCTRLFAVQQALSADIDKLQAVKRSTRKELFRRLSIARDYMNANPGGKMQLDDIARVACLSVHHFKREFTALYGLSPHRYLLMQRIDKARALLKDSSLSVGHVAMISGFDNVSAFIRQFKACTGQTPGSSRQQLNVV